MLRIASDEFINKLLMLLAKYDDTNDMALSPSTAVIDGSACISSHSGELVYSTVSRLLLSTTVKSFVRSIFSFPGSFMVNACEFVTTSLSGRTGR